MSKHMTIKTTLLLIVILLLAGCGSNEPSGGQATPEATTANQRATAPTQETISIATSAPEDIPPITVVLDTPTPTDVPGEATPPLQPGAPTSVGVGGGSAQEAIISSLRTQAALRSYRGLVTIISTSSPTTMTIEVVRPDRVHTIVDLGGVQRESINIGQDAYIKGPNGWVKLDAQSAALTTINPILADQSQVEEYIAQNKDNWANARLTGNEMVDGKPTKVYEYTVSVTSSAGGQTTTTDSPQRLWIGESDNLPYRLQISSEVNLGGNDVTSTTTFSFFDYNADIKIDTPSPIVTP